MLYYFRYMIDQDSISWLINNNNMKKNNHEYISFFSTIQVALITNILI